MRMLIPFIGVALVACSRLAAGGEGGAIVVSSDPSMSLLRMLGDFGALGLFVVYLILQKRQDNERRLQIDERWHALDRELVGLAKEYSRVTTEVIAVLAEIRTNMQESNTEMRRLNALLTSGRRTVDGRDG